MKLIIEITTKDDKKQTHICNDFPNFGSEFVTLYKDGFKREMIRTETILKCDYYMKK